VPALLPVQQAEYFVFRLFDGKHTMEEVQEAFEEEFQADAAGAQDLEGFARSCDGRVGAERAAGRGPPPVRAPGQAAPAPPLATLTKHSSTSSSRSSPGPAAHVDVPLPVVDLHHVVFVASVGLMLAAVFHVALHFTTFQAKLPAYQEFFTWNSVLYMWISLAW